MKNWKCKLMANVWLMPWRPGPGLMPSWCFCTWLGLGLWSISWLWLLLVVYGTSHSQVSLHWTMICVCWLHWPILLSSHHPVVCYQRHWVSQCCYQVLTSFLHRKVFDAWLFDCQPPDKLRFGAGGCSNPPFFSFVEAGGHRGREAGAAAGPRGRGSSQVSREGLGPGRGRDLGGPGAQTATGGHRRGQPQGEEGELRVKVWPWARPSQTLSHANPIIRNTEAAPESNFIRVVVSDVQHNYLGGW